ncbi:MAG: pyridoxal-phosphate dependent enzyme [Candidatus Heimdallarchaeota archaeon]
MQIFNGKLVATETYPERWQIMNECIEKFGWALVGDYAAPLMVGANPYGIDGYKTMAFEMCEQLDWKSPDLIVEPTGYANGITGVWQGFNEFYKLDFIDSTPKIIAAERFGPLKNALEKQIQFPEPVELEPSVAVSIAGNISSFHGLKTITESGGFAETVTDQEILSMQKKLGREGIYAEVSSVASLAVIKKLVEQGKIDQDEVVIAIVTSGGLKDPDVTRKILPEVPIIKPDMQELSAVLKNVYNYLL